MCPYIYRPFIHSALVLPSRSGAGVPGSIGLQGILGVGMSGGSVRVMRFLLPTLRFRAKISSALRGAGDIRRQPGLAYFGFDGVSPGVAPTGRASRKPTSPATSTAS